MSDFLAPLSSTLADGPLHQLLAMGGPVMIVLLVMAVLGLVTFIYPDTCRRALCTQIVQKT